MAQDLELRLVLDAVDKAQATLDNVKNKIGDIEGGLERADKAGGGFRGTLQRIGETAAGFALGAAITQIPGQISGAISAASDLNETLSKSNTIFGASAKTIEDWASGAARDFGQSKRQALEAAASFGNLFSQIGIGSDVSADMSMSITELASDFASFHNADISEVINAQSAAFRGEYDSLQRFIPTINAASVEQKALAMTGKASTKELNEQDKALAVHALMLEGAGKAAGDFDRTSDELANKQRIVDAEMENVRARIGNYLLPIMLTLATFILDTVIPAFGKIVDVLTKYLGPAFDFIADVFSNFSKYIQVVLDDGDTLNDFLGNLPGPLRDVAFYVGELILKFQDFVAWTRANVIPIIRDISREVGEYLLGKLEKLGRFIRDDVIPALQEFAGFIDSDVLPIIRELADRATELGSAVADKLAGPLERVFSFVREHQDEFKLFGVAMAVAVPIVYALAAALTAEAAAAAPAAVATNSLLLPVLAISAALAALTVGVYLLIKHWDDITARFPILGRATEEVRASFNHLVDVVRNDVIPAVQATTDFVLSVFLPIWSRVSDFFATILPPIVAAFVTFITSQFDAFRTILEGVIDFVVGVFTGDWSRAWDGIKQIVSGIIDAIKAYVEFQIQVMVTVVTGFIETFRDDINRLFGVIRDWVIERITELRDGVVDLFTRMRDKLAELAGNARDWVTDRFTETKNNIVNQITDAKDNVLGIFDDLKSGAISRVDDIKSAVTNRFKNLRDDVTEFAGNLKDNFLSAITIVRDLVGGIFNSIRSNIASPANRVIDGFNRMLGGLVGGVNKVAGWLGVNLGLSWTNIPEFAKGVTNFRGGLAIVGEEGPELVELPPGSNVLTARQTEAILRAQREGVAIGGPFDSVKNFGSDVLGGIKNVGSDIAAGIRKYLAMGAGKLVDMAIGALPIPDLPPMFAGFGQAIFSKLKDAFVEVVEGWIKQVEEALPKATGIWARPLNSYVVTQEFGNTEFSDAYASGQHSGIDLGAPLGTPILATDGGTVTLAGWNGGYGNAVMINHGNGLASLYGHMQTIMATVGQIVGKLEQIGTVDSTGFSTGNHLHFEARQNGVAVNPRNFVALAEGGIVTEPTMALIGEAGPEAVIPLSATNPGGLPDFMVNQVNEGAKWIKDLLMGARSDWNKFVAWINSVPNAVERALTPNLLRIEKGLRNHGYEIPRAITEGVQEATHSVAIPGIISTGTEINDATREMAIKGITWINDLKNGSQTNWGEFVNWLSGIPREARDAIGPDLVVFAAEMKQHGFTLTENLTYGMMVGGEDIVPAINQIFGGMDQALFDGFQQNLATLDKESAIVVTEGVKWIDQLQDGSYTRWGQFINWLNSQPPEIRMALMPQLAALQDDLGERGYTLFDDMHIGAIDSLDKTKTDVSTAAEETGNSVVDSVAKGAKDTWDKSVGPWFNGLGGDIADETDSGISVNLPAVRASAAQILWVFMSMFDSLELYANTVMNRIMKNIQNTANAVSATVNSVAASSANVPGFASGVRNFRGGWAMVGEDGPELLYLPRGSNVYAHGEMPGNSVVLNLNMTVDARGADSSIDFEASVERVLNKVLERHFTSGATAYGVY